MMAHHTFTCGSGTLDGCKSAPIRKVPLKILEDSADGGVSDDDVLMLVIALVLVMTMY